MDPSFLRNLCAVIDETFIKKVRDMNELHAEMKKVRNSYGITEEDLADLLGWPVAKYVDYENMTMKGVDMIACSPEIRNVIDVIKSEYQLPSTSRSSTLQYSICGNCSAGC